jgi:hypothetical protein
MEQDHIASDLVDMLRVTREAERDVFGALDPAVRDRPMREGDWSPKDHQAHLTAWKARQAKRYEALRGGTETPPTPEDETDEINAELQAARAGWDWEAIELEADEVSERLAAQVLATDPQLIRRSEQTITSTFGNGAYHALQHFGWLADADVGTDRDRVNVFADEIGQVVARSSLPDRERGTTAYNVACYLALGGRLAAARSFLRDAFRLRPDLAEFAATDSDLAELREELAELAGSSAQ